jgi:hypothetical protein
MAGQEGFPATDPLFNKLDSQDKHNNSDNDKPDDDDDTQFAQFKESFQALGLIEKQAEVAARGRA